MNVIDIVIGIIIMNVTELIILYVIEILLL